MGQIPRSIERISSYHNCHPGKFHKPRCIQVHRISSNYICMYCTHQCSFSELFSSQDQVQGYCPSLTFVLAAVLWRRLPASGGILPPRHISSSRAHSNKIPTAMPMFSGSNFLMVPLQVSRDVDIRQKSKMAVAKMKCTYFTAVWPMKGNF